MFELVIGFIVATILFIAEYLLCTKLKSPLWGGIIPVLILAGTIWIFATERGFSFPDHYQWCRMKRLVK